MKRRIKGENKIEEQRSGGWKREASMFFSHLCGCGHYLIDSCSEGRRGGVASGILSMLPPFSDGDVNAVGGGGVVVVILLLHSLPSRSLFALLPFPFIRLSVDPLLT